jgi:hypothetical protein
MHKYCNIIDISRETTQSSQTKKATINIFFIIHFYFLNTVVFIPVYKVQPTNNNVL